MKKVTAANEYEMFTCIFISYNIFFFKCSLFLLFLVTCFLNSRYDGLCPIMHVNRFAIEDRYRLAYMCT